MHLANPARFAQLRRASLTALLWVGLALCVAAVSQHWREAVEFFQNIGTPGVAAMALALVSGWVLAVASWQQVVLAHGGPAVRQSVAARHLALLLLGKYLPGGIWGFVARLSDSSTRQSRAAMFAAGVSEQWLGLVSMVLLAAAGFLAGYRASFGWLFLVLLIPILAMFSTRILYQSLNRLSRLLPEKWRPLSGMMLPNKLRLRNTALLIALQQTLILLMIAFVSAKAFSLDAAAALAVASSYGIAVVAGIAVVFAPGGILVREGVFIALSRYWLDSDQAIVLAAGLRLLFAASDVFAGLLAGGLHIKGVRRGAA